MRVTVRPSTLEPGPGGRARFREVRAEASDGDLRLELDIVVDDLGVGRLTRVELTSSGADGLDSRSLREVPLGDLVQRAVSAATSFDIVAPGTVALSPAPRAGRVRRRGSSLDRELLRRVVDAYERARARGETAAAEIQRSEGVSKAQAYRYIERARAEGLLS